MPPKVKKISRQPRKEAQDLKKKETEEEKENLQSRGRKKPTKFQAREKTPEGDKLFLQPLTPQMNDCTISQTEIDVKPTGFWSKKLQDLEESQTKKKRHGLYEFSGTDESESSYKAKKKQKQKVRLQKKRQQPIMPKYNKAMAKPDKKTDKIQEKVSEREQLVLIKERKHLADEGKKFTFSLGMQSLGITSTPAINKDNLVGASNFLFLSPINREDEDCCNDVTECLPVGLKTAGVSPQCDLGTPKLQTKLKRLSCRRVLRSGKVLGPDNLKKSLVKKSSKLSPPQLRHGSKKTQGFKQHSVVKMVET